MISENLNAIRAQIAGQCNICQRSPDTVSLIAVSKTHPAEAIAEAYTAGQRIFGENKVQELELKVPLLPEDIEWHLIGHLQSNKAAKAVALAHWIHAVDTEELLFRLDRLAAEAGKMPNILLEINISGEESKHGFYPEQTRSAIAAALQCPRLKLQGLMTMAPADASSSEIKRIFNALKELRNYMANEFEISLPHLSMGMSGDFAEAIAEGATFVRIGSAIFGSRP